ncbi:MAG: hypothetical protein K6A05_01075 [Lachnospiraceae bacterium]|nr:hypothetical protein [Lachnospiraceae bacterium]
MFARTNKDIIDDLKLQLNRLDDEAEQLRKELERIEGKRNQIIKDIAEHSDEKYEADMLQQVYEQRRKQ